MVNFCYGDSSVSYLDLQADDWNIIVPVASIDLPTDRFMPDRFLIQGEFLKPVFRHEGEETCKTCYTAKVQKQRFNYVGKNYINYSSCLSYVR